MPIGLQELYRILERGLTICKSNYASLVRARTLVGKQSNFKLQVSGWSLVLRSPPKEHCKFGPEVPAEQPPNTEQLEQQSVPLNFWCWMYLLCSQILRVAEILREK